MVYERRKHSGELPIVGVNVFKSKNGEAEREQTVELMRSSDEEKQHQLEHLRSFKERNAARAGFALERLKATARRGDNVFGELMETVKVCSLGQITQALFEVGGEYRRNM